MIYSSNEKGEGFLAMSAKEHKDFQAGLTVGKVTGSCHGTFKIVAAMVKIGDKHGTPDKRRRKTIRI